MGVWPRPLSALRVGDAVITPKGETNLPVGVVRAERKTGVNRTAPSPALWEVDVIIVLRRQAQRGQRTLQASHSIISGLSDGLLGDRLALRAGFLNGRGTRRRAQRVLSQPASAADVPQDWHFLVNVQFPVRGKSGLSGTPAEAWARPRCTHTHRDSPRCREAGVISVC